MQIYLLIAPLAIWNISRLRIRPQAPSFSFVAWPCSAFSCGQPRASWAPASGSPSPGLPAADLDRSPVPEFMFSVSFYYRPSRRLPRDSLPLQPYRRCRPLPQPARCPWPPPGPIPNLLWHVSEISAYIIITLDLNRVLSFFFPLVNHSYCLMSQNSVELELILCLWLVVLPLSCCETWKLTLEKVINHPACI